jgi:hypothetical protein
VAPLAVKESYGRGQTSATSSFVQAGLHLKKAM